MINRQEIEQKAAEFEINIASVQRDFVLGHFLFVLFSQSGLKTLLFLKGAMPYERATSRTPVIRMTLISEQRPILIQNS